MKPTLLSSLLIAALIGLGGCDFTAAEDAFNEFDVIIALDEVNSFVALKVVDGQTQNFVDGEAQVRFMGDDAEYVIDMFSDPVTEMTISGGLGSFGVSNSRTPTASDPVSVRVQVSAPGYQSNTATLTLQKSGRTDGQIVLFRESAVPLGSETGSGSGVTTTPGVMTEDFRTQTDSNPVNLAEAGVFVPAGTHGESTDGDPASGTWQTDIVYYTANSTTTAEAFPGGFNTPVQSLGGDVSNMTMTTAGFMTVTVTDGAGNEITQFDPPIELSMEIAPGTINRHTGAPVQPGDAISYFSYDTTDGIWIEEGETQLTGPGSDGNYLATFFTSHLTTWSAGYTDTGCSSGVFSIDRNGNNGSIFALANSASAGWFGRTIVIPDGDSEFIVADAPSFLTDFDVRFQLAGQTRVIQQNNSICGASGVASFDPSDNLVDVTFELDLGPSCSALRVNDVPTFAIFYKLPGESDAAATPVGSQPVFEYDNLGRITGGTLDVPGLELGMTYRFYTTINNEREERDLRISGTPMTLDIADDVNAADICATN